MWKPCTHSLSLAKQLAVVLLSLTLLSPTASIAQAERPKPQMTAQQAAARAQAQYGGKVLKVKKKNGKYVVKLLLDSGRVTTVTIDAKGR